MNPQQQYWLEELKQCDSKLEKFDEIALELIKFYFVTLFSISTAAFTLYGYKFFQGSEGWFFVVFVPPFILGLATAATFKKIIDRYASTETTRNQISEWIIHGEVKNTSKLNGSPFSNFYTLFSWLITINLFAGLFFAFPFVRSQVAITITFIAIGIAFAGILSSIVLVSLSAARKKARDSRRKADIASLRLALEEYKEANGKYPVAINFAALIPLLDKYTTKPISEPFEEEGQSYGYSSLDGSTYVLEVTFEDGGRKEIGPGDSLA